MSRRKDSDEWYVLDLCDEILGYVGRRQHRFPFLLGDPGSRGRCIRLPVDAWYAEIGLVIEYCERQHSEPIAFFDKPWKVTCSGVSRGEQRKIYDARRKQMLPAHGIRYVEISYSSLVHEKAGRLLRDAATDRSVIRRLLKA
jgi:hypothetical protein